MPHLLNLRALAEESVEDYALFRLEGREAISEPFEYDLLLITTIDPDLSSFIGKLCEFDVSPQDGVQRVFAGRIFAARKIEGGDVRRIQVQVRPAYHALSYASATHMVQDKTSIDIFEALTGDVPGLTKTVNASPHPKKRGYATRFDESEIAFLDRLLAQDGIMYFFHYDRGAGPYRHRMIVTNTPADYMDVESGAAEFLPTYDGAPIKGLEHQYKAASRAYKRHAFDVNLSEKSPQATNTPGAGWSSVYGNEHETFADENGFEPLDDYAKAGIQRVEQSIDYVEGHSSEVSFLAGGRVEIIGGEGVAPDRVLLTSVHHLAEDPWMLPGSRTATYSNSFTAISADRTYRPPVVARDAPGPLLGIVGAEGTSAGEAKVDDKYRVPVLIHGARDYSAKGLKKEVWLPVRQPWGNKGGHGAQFLPRIGTTVIVDFLYGNPDLPFVSGVLFSPENAYPHKAEEAGLKSGWRSVTDKNGAVTQELFFEDKAGEERIWLFTDRNFERHVVKDEIGEIDNDQTLTVKNNRTKKVQGQETNEVQKTRTTKVFQKDLIESLKEIELKVGPSTIKMTPQGIEIKAPQITISADMKLDMKAGLTASLKSVKTDVNGDAVLVLKGGMVMIN